MTVDTVAVWLVIAGASLITYGLRSSFLLTIGRFGGLPPRVERLLPLLPVVVLAALIAPRLLFVDDTLVAGPGNEQLLAGIVAFGVAWYTESMLATVGVGMAVLWLLLWL